jgi:inactivated superfamily I helicase
MPIRRLFHDWSSPLLPQIAARLIPDTNDGRRCDLSGLIVVLPVRRAARRLRELLAERSGGAHVPPRIVTIGDLPELLYEPQRPFASDLVQKLAWIEAIRRVAPERVAHLISTLPDDSDTQGWLALAELLWLQHRELAADGLDCDAVVRNATELPHFTEHKRWEILAELQREYLQILDSLSLWDVQTARLVAVRQREIRTRHDIFLVGTTDLNLIDRACLDQVADRVSACIHAPEDLADCFDEYGCVAAAAWTQRPIELAPEQLVVAEGPSEQVDAVARILMHENGRYRADEITIALATDALAPHLRRTLREHGIAARWGVGAPLSESAPCRLLEAVADYLEEPRTAHFAALVRHPDVCDWLTLHNAHPGWLSGLDEFISEHIPDSVQEWVQSRSAPIPVMRVAERIDALVKPLRGRPRPVRDWSSRLLRLVTSIYEQSEFDAEQAGHLQVLKACEALQEVLAKHALVPSELAPSATAATAIRLMLRDLAPVSVPSPANADALDLMGWLDAALDDAPLAIIVGLNEGLIPQSSTADPFLPDSLRQLLGMTDNSRRYARDAHALTSILHSRQHVHLVAARRDRRGDPLAPSRLLLAADAETIARRVLSFYSRRSDADDAPLPSPLQPRSDGATFAVPRPRPQPEPPAVLRVTMFRDYLASPYRFYLRHIEGLEDVDDRIDELSASAFGDLTHHALKVWGTSDCRDSTDPDVIGRFLSETLVQYAREQYGATPVMAVEIQLEQARMRLEAFARWQAAWAAAGWQVRFTEEDVKEVRFDLGDGRTVQLRGRIDRIDYHPAGRRWTIFDYKTGEKSDSPEQSHQKEGDWIDLQLPLYRHLARPLGVTGDVQLGFIRLPRDTGNVGARIAEWSDDDLAAADRAAQEVARRILDGRFWVELAAAPATLGEYGPICQDGVFGVRTHV